jgi:hypothetical protein
LALDAITGFKRRRPREITPVWETNGDTGNGRQKTTFARSDYGDVIQLGARHARLGYHEPESANDDSA